MHAPLSNRAALGDRASALGLTGVGQGAALGMGIRKRRRTCLAELAKVAWPAPGATLDLDFVNNRGYAFGRGIASATSLIEFTRSTTELYTNSAGVLATAAVNEPVRDFDPVTLLCNGLAVWEPRTNVILRSDDMTNATVWSVGAGLANFFVATTDSLPAPDGAVGLVAKFVTAATTAQGLFARQTGLSMAAGQWATALYVYVPTQSGVTNWGLTNDFADAESSYSGVQTVFDRWVRVSMVTTLAATRTVLDYNIVRNGVAPTNGDGFTFYTVAADVQAGAFITPHIPTLGSQVTRAGDTGLMTGVNFSSWYNQVEGLFFAEFDAMGLYASGAQYIVSAGTSGTNEIRLRYVNAAIAAQIHNASGETFALTAAASVDTVYKLALGYKTNDAAASLNGSVAVTDTNVALPLAANALSIGSQQTGNAFYLNGHIKRLLFFPVRPPNATVQGVGL